LLLHLLILVLMEMASYGRQTLMPLMELVVPLRSHAVLPLNLLLGPGNMAIVGLDSLAYALRKHHLLLVVLHVQVCASEQGVLVADNGMSGGASWILMRHVLIHGSHLWRHEIASNRRQVLLLDAVEVLWRGVHRVVSR
jgi:hypothetical protein